MIREQGDRKCHNYFDFRNRTGERLGQNSIEDLGASQEIYGFRYRPLNRLLKLPCIPGM